MPDERPPKLAERLGDPEAEQNLIGQLLVWPAAIEKAVTELDPTDLSLGPARVAFQALGELWVADQEVTAISVAKQAAQIDPSFDRSVLVDWMGHRDVGTVDSLVARLRRLAVNRDLYRGLQTTFAELSKPNADGLALAAELSLKLETLGARGDSTLPLQDAYDVAMRPEAEVPWLIPGLLFRQDAVIIVAGEGAGKSTMARQVALCAEAGLHPFTRAPIEPIRTLTIDLENKRRAVTDSFRMTLRAIQARRGMENWRPEGMVWEAPGGMNLLDGRDRRRVAEAVRRTRPDLLFFGPIYKSFRPTAGMKDDAAALEVTAFFDELRDKHDFGMWIEAHAPFGDGSSRDLRPFGTVVWQRWPEYGKNFRWDEKTREIHVGSFRGDRSRVWWPNQLLVGAGSEGGFPFRGRWVDGKTTIIDLNQKGWR